VLKSKLIHCLKRNKFLYNLIHSFYWQLKHLISLMVRTRIEEISWANKKGEAVKNAFTNLNHPHRKFLVDEISKFCPFDNVLEIGCGYGPNLYFLGKKFPDANFVGIDINPLFVREGNKWLKKERLVNVRLCHSKADNLTKFKDRTFDIVFTDAVLMYIGKDKIKQIIENMLRISKKALVFLEQDYGHNPGDPQGLGIYRFGHWQRHYFDLLKTFIKKECICTVKIPPEVWPGEDWGRRGYIIKVTLE